ncbi:ABC transporter ATP-binding protein [Desmospora activa]|uniref:Iron complex transport system ATP-binding protein n=1 Tax=Desmospora activa DSM 45169 TaxID=1121389 RepID=A0A2T4Z8N0_9BACL|nr:ABC transporter ATP-binding protein [Desmospora activa]PTM58215.1 iron complex transport system ATP-binding protein [Desmospora activa DSM 45169]
MIKLQQITYHRQNRRILDSIDWEVHQGEHWALIGPNGAGKTTLLNILNGYIWPSSGTVEVLGKTFGQTDLRQLRKSIGWVSSSLAEQYGRNHGRLTASQVVLSGKHASIGLYDSPSSEDTQQAEQLLETFGCQSLAHAHFHTLSQGEKQRVILARAWIAHPKLLILDEPCSGLDFPAREHLLHAIGTFGNQANGPTILYVSHHVEEILPFISHALLLQQGQILASGPKQQILTSHNLSQLFQMKVETEWQQGRPWIRPA